MRRHFCYRHDSFLRGFGPEWQVRVRSHSGSDKGGTSVGPYAGDSEFAVGVMLGLGWDIRLAKNVSLTPFWNGFAMSNANVDANVGQLGIGFTIH
jgi:hypothetical protein